MDSLATDLLRNICSRAWRDDGILLSPSRVGSHHCFARCRLLTGQEESFCRRYPVWNLYSQTATDLQAVNGAEDATSEPTLGATLCAALAVVYFGRGQCLRETRLMSQCLRVHRQPPTRIAAGSLKDIEKLPTEVSSADRQQCSCGSGLICIPTVFFYRCGYLLPHLMFSASGLTSQALWSKQRAPQRTLLLLLPSASRPRHISYAAGPTTTLHFVRFSSPFHENSAYVSWGFPPQRKQPGRRPKNGAQKRVLKGVGLCCLPAGPGVLGFRSLELSRRVVHISRECLATHMGCWPLGGTGCW